MISKSLLKRIDQKLKIIDSSRPLPPTLVGKLKEQLSIEMTYNSNAIEGNRLTLKETFLVIKEGITVKGRSLKDHLEAKDHIEAIDYLYDLIESNKKTLISEHLIKSLHHLVVKNTEDRDAGKYRSGRVIITGSSHQPPDAYDVPKQMEDFVSWVRTNFRKLHPVELAARAHHKLVYIHPFADGNGRTARLFINLILMQKGYPMVVILKNDRQKYYRALDKADKNNSDDIEKLIAQSVERTMNIYLKVLQKEPSKKEKLLLLSALSKKSTFSEKYLNLLARSGKLEAHKEGRNWVSSLKSLDLYMQSRERKRNKNRK